jgi:hypothetical protein
MGRRHIAKLGYGLIADESICNCPFGERALQFEYQIFALPLAPLCELIIYNPSQPSFQKGREVRSLFAKRDFLYLSIIVGWQEM